MKKRLLELFWQIIPVMIGVYLGFMISNWSENRRDRSDSEKLRKNLRIEIESNRNIINDRLTYHIMLRDSARALSRSQSDNPSFRFFEGTKIKSLAQGVFDSGAQTGLMNNLPLETIARLNKMYTFQQEYNEYGFLILNGMINMELSTEVEALKKIGNFLAITMTDIVISEQELLNGYEKLLEEL